MDYRDETIEKEDFYQMYLDDLSEITREATVEELAEKMKMTPEEIKDIMKMTLDAISTIGGEIE